MGPLVRRRDVVDGADHYGIEHRHTDAHRIRVDEPNDLDAELLPSLEQFRRDVDWIGVHRHLKVIGIFARLHHRDAKSHYLEDVPRFFAYLDRVLPKYPEFAPLAAIIERHVKPTLREYAHWTDVTGETA